MAADVSMQASQTPAMKTLKMWAADASCMGANAGDPTAKTSNLEDNDDNDLESQHPQPNLPRIML
jgi:hypothetical protein